MTYREQEVRRLADFHEDEARAFGAWVRAMVVASGHASPQEHATLAELAAELGEDELWELVELAGEEEADGEQLLAFARKVTRPAVQDIVLDAVYRLSLTDTIAPSEMRLLDELKTLWKLE